MTRTGGLRVVQSAPQLLVEDLGRPGWAHLGVPSSGALDPVALRLANRLVGNAERSAGLEVLVGDCAFVAEQSLRLAATGAQLPLTVDGSPRPWGEAVSVRGGQRVEVGTSSSGLRAWLAVSGGVDTPEVFGSRSTDTLTGLGPAPLKAGDVVPIGTAAAGPPVDAAAVPDRSAPGPSRLRIRLGPRADEFTYEAVAAFVTQEYAVSSSSDRVGLRLQATRGVALSRRFDRAFPSEGVVTGAVQVPSGGQPIVFLADHPVTGGYPVIGVVDPEELRRCAQLRPGDLVSFVEAQDSGA